MIKDNQQHFNRLHVIIDAFVIAVSYIIAWWLKFSSGILDSPGGALSLTAVRVFQCRDGEHCRFSVDFYSIVQPAVLCGAVSKFLT